MGCYNRYCPLQLRNTDMAFLQICFVQLLACSLNALSIRIVYLPPLIGGAMFF